MRRRLAAAVLILAAVTSLRPAIAQVAASSPAAVLQISCMKLSGDVRSGPVPRVKWGGRIHLQAPRGCVVAGSLVSLIVLGPRQVVGQTHALEDGTVTIDASLPFDIEPGNHSLVVEIGGKTQATQAIAVVSNFDATSPVAARTSSPRRDVALLAMWALGILGAGAIFGSLGWRMRTHGAGGLDIRRVLRLRRVPAGDVPRIDTSGFLPGKIARTPAGGGKGTEA